MVEQGEEVGEIDEVDAALASDLLAELDQEEGTRDCAVGCTTELLGWVAFVLRSCVCACGECVVMVRASVLCCVSSSVSLCVALTTAEGAAEEEAEAAAAAPVAADHSVQRFLKHTGTHPC